MATTPKQKPINALICLPTSIPFVTEGFLFRLSGQRVKIIFSCFCVDPPFATMIPSRYRSIRHWVSFLSVAIESVIICACAKNRHQNTLRRLPFPYRIDTQCTSENSPDSQSSPSFRMSSMSALTSTLVTSISYKTFVIAL